jgi:hypothetical protein
MSGWIARLAARATGGGASVRAGGDGAAAARAPAGVTGWAGEQATEAPAVAAAPTGAALAIAPKRARDAGRAAVTTVDRVAGPVKAVTREAAVAVQRPPAVPRAFSEQVTAAVPRKAAGVPSERLAVRQAETTPPDRVPSIVPTVRTRADRVAGPVAGGELPPVDEVRVTPSGDAERVAPPVAAPVVAADRFVSPDAPGRAAPVRAAPVAAAMAPAFSVGRIEIIVAPPPPPAAPAGPQGTRGFAAYARLRRGGGH